MPAGRLGGNGNMIKRGIWIFISCCIVVAIIGTFPASPKGVMDTLTEKSEGLRDVASVAKDWVDGAVSHFDDTETVRDEENVDNEDGQNRGKRKTSDSPAGQDASRNRDK